MFARKLQEQYDFELAQRLTKRDRTRNLLHTKLSSSQAKQHQQHLLSPISIDSDDVDSPRPDRRHQNDDSPTSNHIPASFQTDILYHMARHKSPRSRPLTTSRSDLDRHVSSNNENSRSREVEFSDFEPLVTPRPASFQHRNRNQRSSNHRTGQNDPVNSLASAFSILNNHGSV